MIFSDRNLNPKAACLKRREEERSIDMNRSMCDYPNDPDNEYPNGPTGL